MDRVRKIPKKLLECNQRFYHQMELENSSANATAANGRMKEGMEEGRSTVFIVE